MSEVKEAEQQPVIDPAGDQPEPRPHFTLDVQSVRHVLTPKGQEVEKHG